MKWHRYFLRQCEAVATGSKDPSTQVGAVIVRPDKTIAATGWNGFPRGVEDKPERYADRQVKYRYVCHAEANAIITAREPLHGYTLYASMYPCNECAKLIIQSGIRHVVSPRPTDEQVERWGESFAATKTMFAEARVQPVFICEGELVDE
jgi:dCMP deaminase